MLNSSPTCTLINLATGRCFEPSHRCCDCGQHVLPAYNDRNELIDHDCPSPSSNY